ncbi:unnamed protein product [Bursaphelenchus okinawaensis]|uniref:Uncharacterized protein n=1 Tax=Bursaphelenchus okinawaensis TaxID=465554 RepID=A0A811K9R0_9BILA|nr:unnamed protein product [Bursaphelenchus okinawaensis]CAG9094896.1 unnamed protein product [Bursaphelenchus okinawaensis]
MSCNPCCGWRLKDASATIGIWSCLYSLAVLGMFAWQWGVLSQCQHVTMAQSNLQCEYYCPCVGASTARTSAIIEALFVVQILCLITSLFHLFASLGLLYGIHTWSRYLILPWIITTLCTILTSLAYCITWWAGDVRDYWLVLTILVFFTIIVNTYCFVTVWIFYKRMNEELKYYEGKKANKYNKFPPPNQGFVYDPDDDFRYPHPDARMTEEEFNWRNDNMPMPEERFDNIPGDPMHPGYIDDNRPKSVPPFHPTPYQYDDFADVPRQVSRHSHRKHSCHCHRHRKPKRRHRSRHHKDDVCSSSCSTEYTGTEETVSTHPAGRRHHSHHDHRRRSHSRCLHRAPSPKSQKTAVVQVDPEELSRGDSNVGTLMSNGGFTIPQHIVIPPETNADPTQPRKYQINSEITISYDPKQDAPQEGLQYPRSPNPISFTSNV